jgi:phage baseplate assembly protein W
MRGTNARTGKILSGLAHLRQSIRDILTTPLGSRVMRRNYGSRLFDLVDNPLNEQTLVELFAATAEALIRWEPRLQVTRVQARRFTAEDASVPSAPVNVGPPGMIIGGTLTPNAVGTYSYNGVDFSNNPQWLRDTIEGGTITWDIAESRWRILIPTLPGFATWVSDETTLSVTPLPSAATGWVPGLAVVAPPATGTPIVTEAARPVVPAFVPQNSRAGSIVIDLEAIYLLTGQPVFLDGIVI